MNKTFFGRYKIPNLVNDSSTGLLGDVRVTKNLNYIIKLSFSNFKLTHK